MTSERNERWASERSGVRRRRVFFRWWQRGASVNTPLSASSHLLVFFLSVSLFLSPKKNKNKTQVVKQKAFHEANLAHYKAAREVSRKTYFLSFVLFSLSLSFPFFPSRRSPPRHLDDSQKLPKTQLFQPFQTGRPPQDRGGRRLPQDRRRLGRRPRRGRP